MGAKFEVQYTPLDELKKLEQAQYKEKGLGATGWILRRIWTEGATLYESRDNEKIGAPAMETLADAVARAIKIQTQ